MTIGQLIECLKDYRDDLGEDVEVLLGAPPCTISGVASSAELDELDDVGNEASLPAVYIIEGQPTDR